MPSSSSTVPAGTAATTSWCRRNLTLLKLPPYAPELNSAENVWEYLRKNKLAQRLYANYHAIVDACCQAWNDFVADPSSRHLRLQTSLG